MRSHFLLCCSVPNRKHPDCSERMQKNGRCDNSLLTKGRSSIEIQSANEKEVTLSGNHVKGGGSYESPSLYMGHVVERCADRSTGRLLQISFVVHVVLIPTFFLQSTHLCNMKQNGHQNAAFGCFALMSFYDIVSFTAATAIAGYRNSSVSFCNTASLLISDFFPAPLAKQP